MAELDNITKYDSGTVIKASFQEGSQVLKTMSGFLLGGVGRKIEKTLISTRVEDYTFTENSTVLITYRITWNDDAKTDFKSVETTFLALT